MELLLQDGMLRADGTAYAVSAALPPGRWKLVFQKPGEELLIQLHPTDCYLSAQTLSHFPRFTTFLATKTHLREAVFLLV